MNTTETEIVKSAPIVSAEGAPLTAETMEMILINQDLSKLQPWERMDYYQAVCRSLSLNPLTKPFNYITLDGKMVLYATKDCTEQLRKIHAVSITIIDRVRFEGCFMVTARAVNGRGRQDESIGVVDIDGLAGKALANALMRSETKAKRRVTLSICGLGMMDESEAGEMTDADKLANLDNQLLNDERVKMARLGLNPDDAEPFVPTKTVSVTVTPDSEPAPKAAPKPPKAKKDASTVTPEPEKPASEPVENVEKPAEPEAQNTDWRKHAIGCIKSSAEFTGKCLADLTFDQLERLVKAWVNGANREKIMANPVAAHEAKMMSEAYMARGEEEQSAT